jgi:hypothetical protein
MQSSILAAADADFIQGIRVAIATAIAVLIVVFAAGFAWFPRGEPPPMRRQRRRS